MKKYTTAQAINILTTEPDREFTSVFIDDKLKEVKATLYMNKNGIACRYASEGNIDDNFVILNPFVMERMWTQVQILEWDKAIKLNKLQGLTIIYESPTIKEVYHAGQEIVIKDYMIDGSGVWRVKM